MIIKDFDIYSSYGFLFNHIATNIRQRLEVKLKSHNITILQFAILLNVYKRGPFLQKEIIKFTNSDEPSTARVVKRLEEKGFLKRVVDNSDKRIKMLHTTQNAEKLLDELIPYAIENNEHTVSALNDEEKRTLLILLQKITAIDK